MLTVRQFHLATLLANGQVLVVGGLDKNGIGLASAELYDPTAGKWAATGSTTTLRTSSNTATLLPNEQVLVAGSSEPAELYDPSTGMWTETGSLINSRSNHTATLLTTGQVLVTGGKLYDHSVASSELYNPATGLWTLTGSLTFPRSDHTATLLPNGQVMVAGGERTNPEGSVGPSEVYDPVSGSWTTTGPLFPSRYGIRRHYCLTAGCLPLEASTSVSSQPSTSGYRKSLGLRERYLPV